MWLVCLHYMLQSLYEIYNAESKGAKSGKSKKKNRRKKTNMKASTNNGNGDHKVSTFSDHLLVPNYPI